MAVSYRFIGKGKTDANGVAHITEDANGDTVSPPGYVGTGAGELDIVASMDKPIASGSVVSQPLSVIDAIMRDDGTSVKNWDYKNNLEQSSDGTECTLTQTSSSSVSVKRIDSLDGDYGFAFDVKLVSGDFYVNFRKESTAKGIVYANNMNLSDNQYHHIVLKVIGSSIGINVDGVDSLPRSLSDTWNRFYFNLEGGAEVKYKNFYYYPL